MVIPVEISLSNIRTSDFSPNTNEDLMVKQLALLEEHREATTIRLENYQQKLAQWYNKGVKIMEFGAGALVLSKVVGNA